MAFKDPCRHPKDSPCYIDPEKLKNATLDELTRYRLMVAKEVENDLKEVEIEVQDRRIRMLYIGIMVTAGVTLLASLIGSGVLLYTKGEGKNSSLKSDSLVELNLIAKNTEKNVNKLYDISRSDYKTCQDLKLKITDLHRQQYPEQYRNFLGQRHKKRSK